MLPALVIFHTILLELEVNTLHCSLPLQSWAYAHVCAWICVGEGHRGPRGWVCYFGDVKSKISQLTVSRQGVFIQRDWRLASVLCPAPVLTLGGGKCGGEARTDGMRCGWWGGGVFLSSLRILLARSFLESLLPSWKFQAATRLRIVPADRKPRAYQVHLSEKLILLILLFYMLAAWHVGS